MHRLESDRKFSRSMIHELEKTANTVNRLMSNFRVCSNSIEDILMAQYQKQAEQLKEDPAEQHETATSVYRIVKQKFQFTEWQKWSREEQIKNSMGTDEATALSGNCCIPKYCILTLKEK